jgi:anti-anti-sigma factor
MPEPFQIQRACVDDRTVLLRVGGRLDSASAPQLVHRCTAVKTAGGNLVLNLEGVSFIASSGVGALLAIVEQFRDSGCGIRFVAPSPAVDSVIRLLNLDQFLPIDATEGEAIVALKAA